MTGAVIWYELMTDAVAAAASFYARVLGWRAVDSGLPGPGYRYWRHAGEDVGGLMALPDEARAAGARPAWFPYLHEPQVEARIATVAAAGGAVYMPATEVPGVGRFAMLADPQGAAFYVMAPVGAGASPAFSPERIGHGGWNELQAADLDAARAFYAAQFGWQSRGDAAHPAGGQCFGTASGDELGAMVQGDPGTRAWWLCAFNCDDIDAATRRLRAAGGKALDGLRRLPNGKWLLPAEDPQGARFGLVGLGWGD